MRLLSAGAWDGVDVYSHYCETTPKMQGGTIAIYSNEAFDFHGFVCWDNFSTN